MADRELVVSPDGWSFIEGTKGSRRSIDLVRKARKGKELKKKPPTKKQTMQGFNLLAKIIKKEETEMPVRVLQTEPGNPEDEIMTYTDDEALSDMDTGSDTDDTVSVFDESSVCSPFTGEEGSATLICYTWRTVLTLIANIPKTDAKKYLLARDVVK
jgi:hypothetical protein